MSRGAIAFHRPLAFWLGAAAITAGVILHLPMYVSARVMDYELAGMPVDGPMAAGMVLITVGLVATLRRWLVASKGRRWSPPAFPCPAHPGRSRLGWAWPFATPPSPPR